jgi:hypothetical protein
MYELEQGILSIAELAQFVWNSQKSSRSTDLMFFSSKVGIRENGT